MAISLIGTNAANGTSVAIPTHQAGDLLLFFAASDANMSSGSQVPAGITRIDGQNSANGTVVFGYKIAASNSETSGTWTISALSHDHVGVWVIRGAASSPPNGAFSSSSVLNGSSIAFNALTMTNSSGSSWVFRGGFVRSSVPDLSAATVSGYTFRQNADDGTSQILMIDSDGGETSVTSQSIALGASYFVGDMTVEILELTGGSTNAPRSMFYHLQGMR